MDGTVCGWGFRLQGSRFGVHGFLKRFWGIDCEVESVG